MESREIAFDLQQQSAKGIGIALYFFEGLIVEVENLIEIAQQRLAFENIGIGIDANVILFFLIVLVVDFANNRARDRRSSSSRVRNKADESTIASGKRRAW